VESYDRDPLDKNSPAYKKHWALHALKPFERGIMPKNNNKRRTTVLLYPETDQILETHNINLTEELNHFIQRKYGSVDMLDQKETELRAEKRKQLEIKQEAERKKNEIEDQLDRIERLRTRHDILDQLKRNPEKKKQVQEQVMILRRAKNDGDSKEEIQRYTKSCAETLIKDKGVDGFEQETLEETLKLLAEIS